MSILDIWVAGAHRVFPCEQPSRERSLAPRNGQQPLGTRVGPLPAPQETHTAHDWLLIQPPHANEHGQPRP